MTYQQFISRVRRELEEATASTWSDSSLLDWTNDAIRDFFSKVKPSFDEQYTNSVANSETYDMPADTLEVVRVAYDGSFLVRCTEQDYFVFSVKQPDAGTPVRYALIDGIVYLHPTPDTAGKQIRFWRKFRPEAITDVNSVQDMPLNSEHDDAFGYFVKARAWEQVGDFDSAKMNDQLYTREVDESIWSQLDESMGNYYHEATVVW